MKEMRYAFRSLLRNPTMTLIAVVTLALGIGANTAVFSVIRAVLLSPLPYPEADRLVWMWTVTPDGSNNTTAALDYMDYREHSTTLEQLAAYSTWPERYVTTGGDEPEVLVGAAASWNLFRALGTDPVIGRGFMVEDEDPAS